MHACAFSRGTPTAHARVNKPSGIRVRTTLAEDDTVRLDTMLTLLQIEMGPRRMTARAFVRRLVKNGLTAFERRHGSDHAKRRRSGRK